MSAMDGKGKAEIMVCNVVQYALGMGDVPPLC